MNRRQFFRSTSLFAAGIGLTSGLREALPQASSASLRSHWVTMLEKTARPVLSALSQRTLKRMMPVECQTGQQESRRLCTYLEALGRTLSGIAPWLESGSEINLREQYRSLTQQSIAAAVDPTSPDAMPFGAVAQTLVDSAFLSLGLLRAPTALIDPLPTSVRQQLIQGLQRTRSIQPPINNWLLFSAVVEAGLERLGAKWNRAPVELAIARHREWYVGDGVYGDGPHFHADYYDSYVIHPFLLALLKSPVSKASAGPDIGELEYARARRYAAIQERMIASDGTWPVSGRSITYRCGAFHLLADMSLRKQLPENVRPAQVREALSAAIRVSLGARESFDANGWLTIGLAGHQPSLGETYISTGSLYLCLNAFLPLGLPADDDFWTKPPAAWTAQRAWTGQDLQSDHAIND